MDWGDAHHHAFTELKNALTNAPVLAKPDCSRAFIVDADASNDAVGPVLSQVTEGAEHPVYFHSRVLKDAERASSVTEREALAVVVAVVKFRPYILGRTIVVRTDHIPIIGLLRKRDLTGRCAR